MLVTNLVPWAGSQFSYAPGDLVELPDDVAQARVSAGLAAPPPAAQGEDGTQDDAGEAAPDGAGAEPGDDTGADARPRGAKRR